MSKTTPIYVILLRAIGPATHRLMTMSQWRDAAGRAGFVAPETLVNTGNLIAGFDDNADQVARRMTDIVRGFGLGENVVPVVRPPALLAKIVEADPIPEAAAMRPNQTGIYFFVEPKPDFGWLGEHDGPEVVHVVHHHLVVDFSRDVAQASKLIRKIDKHCGTNTARNWNSLGRIAERSRARETE